MGITVQVQDSKGSGRKGEVYERDEIVGPVVYTRDFASLESTIKPFTNELYGNDLAQDASFGGTPVRIHDGIDSVLWTGSQISGTKVTFNSTDRAQAGLQSVKVANPSVSDTWEFLKATPQSLSGYVGLTGYINIDKDWSVGDSVSIYGWDGALVGNEVFLEDYININLFDNWQFFTIPLSDMGLSAATVDSFRMTQVSKTGPAATWYLDEFMLQETGGNIRFSVRADQRQVFYVDALRFTFADNVTGSAALSYDKILGVTLANGITITLVKKGAPQVSAVYRSIGTFYSSGYDRSNISDDGTNTLITLELQLSIPIVINSLYDESINIDISDDLSGFLVAVAIAKGKSDMINTQGKLIR